MAAIFPDLPQNINFGRLYVEILLPVKFPLTQVVIA